MTAANEKKLGTEISSKTECVLENSKEHRFRFVVGREIYLYMYISIIKPRPLPVRKSSETGKRRMSIGKSQV